MRRLLDIVRQSLVDPLGAQAALVPDYVRDCVGRGFAAAGGGVGVRLSQEKQLARIGQNIMFMFPGRTPAVEGSTQSGQLGAGNFRLPPFAKKGYLMPLEKARKTGHPVATKECRGPRANQITSRRPLLT